MIQCDVALQKIVQSLHSCDVVEGASRVSTTCLYPDGDSVVVFVYRSEGDTYVVTDDGKAFDVIRGYGVRVSKGVYKSANTFADQFSMRFESEVESFFSDKLEIDQIESAIVFMANTMQRFAEHWNEKRQDRHLGVLRDEIFQCLEEAKIPEKIIARDYEISGESGKSHGFDCALLDDGTKVLIDAVGNHHGAIASSHLKFSDVRINNRDYGMESVIDRALPWNAVDIRLVSAVSNVNYIDQKMSPLLKKYKLYGTI
jgi:hypothetical protein